MQQQQLAQLNLLQKGDNIHVNIYFAVTPPY